MKKIYYFASSPHPVHEGFISKPPNGYIFFSNVSSKDTEKIRQYEKNYRLMLNVVNKFSKVVNPPRFKYLRTDCDLIHTNSGVLVLNRKPWVVSVEYGNSFLLNPLRNPKTHSLMKHYVVKALNSKYCRKILPYSIATRNSILNIFYEHRDTLVPKMEVLYPSIMPQKKYLRTKIGKDSQVKILFVGEFFRKGAKELLKAFEILQRDYSIELKMKTVPYTNDPFRQKKVEKILKPYYKFKNIHIINNFMTKESLFELFRTADIFVLPTFGDWVPYTLFEAMSFGLPIISTDIYAIPEIINDGENGFLINIPEDLNDHYSYVLKSEKNITNKYNIIENEVIDSVVEQLTKKLSILIENTALREHMGERSRAMIENGKFSIMKRNMILKKIYGEELVE